MEIHTTIVDPGGSGVYTSIAAWVAGEAALSVSESWASGDIAFADCRRTTSAKDTSAVTVSGFKEGIIPKIVVHANYRHQGVWADRRDGGTGNYIYHLSVSSNSIILYFSTGTADGSTLDGMCVSFASNSTAEYKNVCDISDSVCIIKNNLLFNLAEKGHRRGVRYAGYRDNTLIHNNIIVNFASYGISSTLGDIYIYNNIIYYSTVGITTSDGGSPVVKNNYCGANSSGDYSMATGGGDYNVSSDASAVGANKATGKNSYTDYFVDLANGDLHLKDTSYNLWGINSENLTATFTTDIDGDTRPNTDQFGIGADYYVAPAGGVTIEAGAGEFTLTGANATLLYNRILGAGAGGFTLTGTPSELIKASILSTEGGTFSLTGTVASLLFNRLLGLEVGEYSLTGSNASLLYNRIFNLDDASFSITGIDAFLLYNRLLGTELGEYSLTGINASLLFNRILGAENGVYNLTGADASLLYNRILSFGLGEYVLTGTDVDLVYLSGGTIIADSGSFSLIGTDASLLYNRLLLTEGGVFTLTGTNASFLRNRLLGLETGEYLLTGTDIDLLYAHLLVSTPGEYVLTGINASLLFNHKLIGDIGSYTLTGTDASLLKQSIINCGNGIYIITGYNTVLNYSGEIIPAGEIAFIFTPLFPKITTTIKQPSMSFTKKN